MSDIKLFNFQDKEVRVFLIQNTPYFVAQDVAEILEYADVRRMLDWVDTEDKEIINPHLYMSDGVEAETLYSNTYRLSVLNESGVYAVIFNSTKPEAKVFRKWVTSEVLPSIRETGSYIHPSSTDTQLLVLMNKLMGRVEQMENTLNEGVAEKKELESFKTEALQFRRFEYLLNSASKKLSEDSYSEGITADGYIILNEIPLDKECFSTLQRRTASFYRAMEGVDPPKNKTGRCIYAGKKVAYIMAVINLICEGI